MTKKGNVWIVPQKGGGWAVKREKAQRSIAVTPTKAEADKIGRRVGKNNGVDVITQGKDGKIQSHDSFGNDPNPPTDKEH
ncbi:MAG: DUF2188 domain-containing protein [Chloroflexi bacterium]|nr:DUF2188 domain-containing protein [Chloroflexota bacterium]